MKVVSYRGIPRFPGYRVGDDGSIWSRRGQGRSTTLSSKWWQLKLSSDRRGYLQVGLCRNGRSLTLYVHRIVLLAFIGPCPAGMEAAHWNGKHSDNQLKNLRWATPKENQADKMRHGTSNKKLNATDVAEIWAAWEAGESQASIARRYDVDPSAIGWRLGRRGLGRANVLTDQDVAEIRVAYEAGESQTSISRRFGVCQSAIHKRLGRSGVRRLKIGTLIS